MSLQFYKIRYIFGRDCIFSPGLCQIRDQDRFRRHVTLKAKSVSVDVNGVCRAVRCTDVRQEYNGIRQQGRTSTANLTTIYYRSLQYIPRKC